MNRTNRLVLDDYRPNPRKIRQAAEVLRDGGVIAYPTDTVYGIGCDLTNRRAIDRIYRIKRLDRGHRLSFICPDLSAVAQYAQVTDFAHRWLRRLLPGPYTVVLPATRMVPKILLEKRREVGVRIPDNEICIELVNALGGPLISTSATNPVTNDVLMDPDIVRDLIGHQIDLILDGGLLNGQPSTVVSFIDDRIEILREGQGPIDLLLGE